MVPQAKQLHTATASYASCWGKTKKKKKVWRKKVMWSSQLHVSDSKNSHFHFILSTYSYFPPAARRSLDHSLLSYSSLVMICNLTSQNLNMSHCRFFIFCVLSMDYYRCYNIYTQIQALLMNHWDIPLITQQILVGGTINMPYHML